jgi:hypothetical protein
MLSDCACVHSYAASQCCTGQAMVDFASLLSTVAQPALFISQSDKS